MISKRSATKTDRFGSFIVRTWWDASSRTWITELVRELAHQTPAGNTAEAEVRPAEITGNAIDAVAAHEEACADARLLFRAASDRGGAH